MSDVGCGKCPRLALWDVALYNDGALDDWRLTVTSVTWILVENLLGGRTVAGRVEVLIPVMPLAPRETQLLAGYPQVQCSPVSAVGAHTPPLALLHHLQ